MMMMKEKKYDPVMPAAVEMLGYEWDPCFVHIFNDIVQNFMEKNEDIYNILKKANLSRKKKYSFFI